MLTLLAVVGLVVGQVDSSASVRSEAERAFKKLLDIDTAWSGKITIDGKDVVVKRLDMVSTEMCGICRIPSLWFTFQFDGDYSLPVSGAAVPRTELGQIQLGFGVEQAVRTLLPRGVEQALTYIHSQSKNLPYPS